MDQHLTMLGGNSTDQKVINFLFKLILWILIKNMFLRTLFKMVDMISHNIIVLQMSTMQCLVDI